MAAETPSAVEILFVDDEPMRVLEQGVVTAYKADGTPFQYNAVAAAAVRRSDLTEAEYLALMKEKGERLQARRERERALRRDRAQ